DGFAGDAPVEGSEQVVANWERIKAVEKGRESVFDGVPRHLPALARALKVMRKTEGLGLDVHEMIGASSEAVSVDLPVDEVRVGELLQSIVELAHRHDVDPEAALRRAADGLEARVRQIEGDAGAS